MTRRTTIADVAARAGVSPTAVSLVLNERPGSRLSPDVVQRVRDAARELDYRPNPAARSLRVGKTATVGFISDDVAVTRYASAMIRGALDVAEKLNHTVLIAETGSNPRRRDEAVAAMLDRRPDGIIFGLMGAKLIDVPDLPSSLPVVLLNSASPQGHASVLPDERRAGHAVARALLDAGHRKIAMIGYSEELRYEPRLSVTVSHRYDGLFAALAEFGVELVSRVAGRNWEPQFGFDGMDRILRQGLGVTAVIALNDNIAFGAYQAIQEHGLRIPDDISVVSFDDDVLASYLRPGLTTAAIPYEEMGRQAMSMLLTAPFTPEQRLVPMPLRPRGSVRTLD